LRLRGIVPFMRLLAIALLIVAIARPQRPNEQSRPHRADRRVALLPPSPL
jgi:hypothetical protein